MKILSLNESPYEKVGKSRHELGAPAHAARLNESPYEKVGKYAFGMPIYVSKAASMKVPTKK